MILQSHGEERLVNLIARAWKFTRQKLVYFSFQTTKEIGKLAENEKFNLIFVPQKNYNNFM